MSVQWIKNLYNPGQVTPNWFPALFQAGSTQAIAADTIIEMGVVASNFTPLASDHKCLGSLAVYAGQLESPVAADDKAGYHKIIIPTPGDIFRVTLAAAAQVSHGDPLYYSTAAKLTTSGTNPIMRAVAGDNYPQIQKHLSLGEMGDMGTTIASRVAVDAVFDEQASYLFALLPRPFLFNVVCTAGGAEDEVVMARAPFKFRVVDAHMYARDTNNVNITLKNGSSAFTAATAKGGTDAARVEFDNITAYSTIAAAGAINATFSGAGSAEIVLACNPV